MTMRRFVRSLGLVMIVAGVGALAWAFTIWQWQDPVTLTLNKLEQRELRQSYERRLAAPSGQLSATPAATSSKPKLDALAARWRTTSKRGDAVARLRIPALGLDQVVVNGTDSKTLRRGPGRYLGSKMPGEGELVYIAGHRTTYGAPFSHLDRLEQGDRVFIELPYGTFEYEITGHRIVPATRVSELISRGREQLALQACHPRFFATQRYIVYGKPVAVTAPVRDSAAEAKG